MTNNEIMKCFVKGFIVETKRIPIDWATIITITKEKSRHEELQKFRSNTRGVKAR